MNRVTLQQANEIANYYFKWKFLCFLPHTWSYEYNKTDTGGGHMHQTARHRAGDRHFPFVSVWLSKYSLLLSKITVSRH